MALDFFCSAEARPERPLRQVAVFMAVVFAITWGIAALLVLNEPLMTKLFGPFSYSSPVFYVAVYAPSVTGILLAVIFQGRAGFEDMIKRLTPRVPLVWWILTIFAFPLAWFAVTAICSPSTLKPELWYAVWPLLIFTTIQLFRDPGPIGEEFGWRGFVMPRLLLKMRPLDAGLLLGFIWGVWHLPAFFLSGLGSHNQMNIAFFILAATGLGVLMTVLFVNARGSFLISGILFHFVVNSSQEAGISNPASLMMQIVVWGLVAVAVIWGGRDLNRGSLTNARGEPVGKG
jgi:uncharacterized protein